jgi:hypothetical protein
LTHGGVRFCKAKVNVRPQSMQRYPPVMQNLAAGYLSPTQPAGTANPYPLGTGLDSTKYRLLHRPPVGNTVLNLVSHRLRHQRGVKLWLMNLHDIQPHSLTDNPLQVSPHLINALPPTPDNDPGTGSMNVNEHLICLPFDFNLGNTRLRIPRLDCLPYLDVLLNKLQVMPIGIPVGLPIPDDSNPKSHWVNFMSH